MMIDNIIKEIREQIVQAVIDANDAGVKCAFPKSFKITRTFPDNIILEYEVPIIVDEKEYDARRNRS